MGRLYKPTRKLKKQVWTRLLLDCHEVIAACYDLNKIICGWGIRN